MTFIDALEHNRRLNDRKSAWVSLASYSVMAAIVLMPLFIAAVVYLLAR